MTFSNRVYPHSKLLGGVMKHGGKTMQSYVIKIVYLILITIPILTSCGGGGGGEATLEREDFHDTTVMIDREVSVNPTESYLYGYTDENGSAIVFSVIVMRMAYL
jgi:hypothetical protein